MVRNGYLHIEEDSLLEITYSQPSEEVFVGEDRFVKHFVPSSAAFLVPSPSTIDEISRCGLQDFIRRVNLTLNGLPSLFQLTQLPLFFLSVGFYINFCSH